ENDEEERRRDEHAPASDVIGDRAHHRRGERAGERVDGEKPAGRGRRAAELEDAERNGRQQLERREERDEGEQPEAGEARGEKRFFQVEAVERLSCSAVQPGARKLNSSTTQSLAR